VTIVGLFRRLTAGPDEVEDGADEAESRGRVRSSRRVCPPSYADQTASADVGSYLATVIKLDLGRLPCSHLTTSQSDELFV
jgi:hypothetical protein